VLALSYEAPVKKDGSPADLSKDLAVLVPALPEHTKAMWMFMEVAVVLS